MERILAISLMVAFAISPAEAGPEQLGVFDVGARHTYIKSDTGVYDVEIVGETMHRGRRVLETATTIEWPEGYSCHGQDADYWDWETGSWVACLRDGEALVEAIPYHGESRIPVRQAGDIPLQAGDKWTVDVQYINYVHPDGSNTSTQNWEVEACGVEVTVPAGTFSTCRVSNERGEVNWFARENGLRVKVVLGGTIIELIAYPGGAPSGYWLADSLAVIKLLSALFSAGDDDSSAELEAQNDALRAELAYLQAENEELFAELQAGEETEAAFAACEASHYDVSRQLDAAQAARTEAQAALFDAEIALMACQAAR